MYHTAILVMASYFFISFPLIQRYRTVLAHVKTETRAQLLGFRKALALFFALEFLSLYFGFNVIGAQSISPSDLLRQSPALFVVALLGTALEFLLHYYCFRLCLSLAPQGSTKAQRRACTAWFGLLAGAISLSLLAIALAPEAAWTALMLAIMAPVQILISLILILVLLTLWLPRRKQQELASARYLGDILVAASLLLQLQPWLLAGLASLAPVLLLDTAGTIRPVGMLLDLLINRLVLLCLALDIVLLLKNRSTARILEQAPDSKQALSSVYTANTESGLPAGFKDRYKLTHRESQIAVLIASGRANKSISQELGVSYSTIKNHTYSLFQKLGISSRFELLSKLTETQQNPADKGK